MCKSMPVSLWICDGCGTFGLGDVWLDRQCGTYHTSCEATLECGEPHDWFMTSELVLCPGCKAKEFRKGEE
jgi:hypothetical protein